MLQDVRGLPLTGTDETALGLLEAALDGTLSFSGDPVGLLDQALARDPSLVMAHALKAHLFAFSLHPALLGRAAEALDKAEDLAAIERERAHLAAARAWVAGDLKRAQALLDGVLRDEPRDLSAMMFAHQADFFGATTAKLLARPEGVLRHWTEDLPGYGYLLGMKAFGLEEAGEYAAAEALGKEAVARNPRDAWAIHAVGHVMEMQGRDAEGLAWYAAREANWASGFFAVHNWWHLGLYHVDRDDAEAALAVYDRGLAPSKRSITLNLSDAASLLWRLWLGGHDVGSRFEALADLFAKPAQAPCHVFNDVHAALTFAGAGRFDAADAHLRRLEGVRDGDHARMLGRFGLPASAACVALARGDGRRAMDLLEPAMADLALMTGSLAQRDVMAMTLIEAWLRTGERTKAQRALEARLRAKPASARASRDLARA